MNRLNSLSGTLNSQQLLFGINQGGIYEDIRISHAQQITELNLDGYAVGGLAVGESHEAVSYTHLDVYKRQKKDWDTGGEPQQRTAGQSMYKGDKIRDGRK